MVGDYRSRVGPAALTVVLFMMSVDSRLALESVTVKCGTNVDITNAGAGNISASITPVSDMQFTNLDTNCYGETKKALLLLKDAIIEGEKCRDNATAMQEKLENMCTLLKPLKGYASKFERALKLLKRIHTALDDATKFINNIPKIGKIRKVLVEKVMPMVLDALETINKGIRKVVDYADKLLEYKDKKKGFKLLWEIDKKGAKVCKLSSPLALSLELVKSTTDKVQNPSKVIVQGFHEGQNCMTAHCQARGGDSSCTECSLVDEGFSRAIPKITTWKQYMTRCHEDLSAANALLDKLAVISALLEIANAIIDAVETFLEPAADQLEKFAKSLGPVMKNLMSCCPCGRPNPVGCSIEIAQNVVNLVTCPLDGITSQLVNNLLSTFQEKVSKFLESSLPKLNIEITLPAVGFEVDVPKFLQECFELTSFHKRFTKLCSLPSEPLKIALGASFEAGKSPSFGNSRSSFTSEIAKSCSEALDAFSKFGKEMSTCFDRVDDAFFAIPVVGAIAAMTCDPNYHDPDPGINYCPCERQDETLLQKRQEQPYCVIWHRSAFKTCASLCTEKNYNSGLNPSGDSGVMHKTYGYPYCERLEYYCREINAVVKNGRVECSNEYIFLGGTCKVIPDPGYVCPVTFIECGSVNATKGVCWNYRFIECAKDDQKHFPMCTCRNSHEFQKGELLCQAGKTTADTLAGVKEMRKSFSCFKPLGLEQDIRKDCGTEMDPCVIQQPNVDAYHRCNLNRAEKFWDAHGGKFAIAGGVIMGLALVFLVGVCCKSRERVSAFIGGLLVLIVGIVMLACGLAIKTPEENDENFLQMGEVFS